MPPPEGPQGALPEDHAEGAAGVALYVRMVCIYVHAKSFFFKYKQAFLPRKKPT